MISLGRAAAGDELQHLVDDYGLVAPELYPVVATLLRVVVSILVVGITQVSRVGRRHKLSLQKHAATRTYHCKTTLHVRYTYTCFADGGFITLVSSMSGAM